MTFSRRNFLALAGATVAGATMLAPRDLLGEPLSVTWVPITNVDPDTNSSATSVRGQGRNAGGKIFTR